MRRRSRVIESFCDRLKLFASERVRLTGRDEVLAVKEEVLAFRLDVEAVRGAGAAKGGVGAGAGVAKKG